MSLGYEVFEQVLKEKGVKRSDIIKDIPEINSSDLSNWKAGRYKPKDNKRKLLARYLGVSLEHLDTGKDTPKQSSEGNTYYFSDETAKIAQEIQNDPARKLLFDASRNASPENIRLAIQMFEQFKRTNADEG